MNVFAVLSSIFVITSNASATPKYTCECQDTGIECDGGERLDFTLSGNQATIKYGEVDFHHVDTFKTKLNPNYKPQSTEHKDFKKFDILSTTSNGYQIGKSYFLIEQRLINGKANGRVKFQSVQTQNTGGGFWSWLFECTLSQ